VCVCGGLCEWATCEPSEGWLVNADLPADCVCMYLTFLHVFYHLISHLFVSRGQYLTASRLFLFNMHLTVALCFSPLKVLCLHRQDEVLAHIPA